MSRELLFSVWKSDFEFQTFRAGGKGGQHQNKTDSAVRIIHKKTGIAAESRSHRSQLQNKKAAFQRLLANPRFKAWISRKAYEAMGQMSVEERVKRDMAPENLKIEVRDGKNWIPASAGMTEG